jgi:hypothetical protein
VDLLTRQLCELQQRYPGARIDGVSEGRVLVVPNVPVGGAWSMPTVTLRIMVPVGYPHVGLDCFYTDPNLRLASGAEPANSSIHAAFGGQYRWFSWHLARWDPQNGTFDRYVRVCERRLRETR